MTAPLPKLSPRHHQLLITLWADGHPVDYLTPNNTWSPLLSPYWDSFHTYSILLERHRLISGPNGVTLETTTTS